MDFSYSDQQNSLKELVAKILEKSISIPDMVIFLQSDTDRLMYNIKIRGIVNNELMDIGMWNPTYGIKMTTYNSCKM